MLPRFSGAVIISVQLFSALLSHTQHSPLPLVMQLFQLWRFPAMAIPTSLSLLPVSLSIHHNHNHNPPTPNRIRAQFHNGASLSPGQDLPPDYETWMPKRDANTRRRAGILLHPTSFPGPFGIGDLGPQAFHFLDWLHLAGCSVWQV